MQVSRWQLILVQRSTCPYLGLLIAATVSHVEG